MRRARPASGLCLLEDVAVGVDDLVMNDRFHLEAASRERGVAVDVLHQRDLGHAQRDRGVAHDLRGDAELAELLDGVVDADRLDQPHRDGVERLRQRGAQRDRAEELGLVVVRRPDAGGGLDRHRRVVRRCVTSVKPFSSAAE